MSNIRRPLYACAVALFATLGLTVFSSTGKATVYNSLTDWNAATPTADFSVNAPGATLSGFLGACPFTGNGNCVATLGDPVPVAASSSTQDTENFINANTLPSWNVDLIDSAKQDGAGQLSGTLTSQTAYSVWVLKADNFLIALLFDTAVTSINFSGLRNGLSHLELGNAPLPPALLLFGSVLAGFFGFDRWRKRFADPLAPA